MSACGRLLPRIRAFLPRAARSGVPAFRRAPQADPSCPARGRGRRGPRGVRAGERGLVSARGQVAGEGRPGELSARPGPRRRVVIRVDGPPDDVAAALAAIPGVLRVERRDGGLALDAAEREDVARAAGAAMQQRGWSILELREEAIDLEEIFLRLVSDAGAGA